MKKSKQKAYTLVTCTIKGGKGVKRVKGGIVLHESDSLEEIRIEMEKNPCSIIKYNEPAIKLEHYFRTYMLKPFKNKFKIHCFFNELASIEEVVFRRPIKVTGNRT